MMKSFFKPIVISAVILSLLQLFVFRSLLTHISTNLLDWNDYPFCAWVISQNIDHFRHFQISGFFNTNIFYPFQGTLLFSEMFLPVSLIGVFITLFTSNPVLIFNLLFFLTLILDVISLLLFWSCFFKKPTAVFLASLIVAFSPFFFLNIVHFQTVVYWPLFLTLYFLCRPERRKVHSIFAGLFLAVQFVSSTYLGIFGLCVVTFWYGLELAYSKLKKTILIHAVDTFVVYFITAGYFIWKYISIQHAYNIVREYWEYVQYSANLTDFMFSTHFNSVISSITPVRLWNAQNKGGGSLFPTITALTLVPFGLFNLLRTKTKQYVLQFVLSKEKVFFFMIMLGGFLASLGPRLKVNGEYIGIVLPYQLAIKTLFFLNPIRVTERWAFFLFVGIAFFVATGFSKLKKLGMLLVGLISILYLLEVMPILKPTEAKNYYPNVYQVVQAECRQTPSVLLEYPIEQDKLGADIFTNLTYRSQYLLASAIHKCTLVNGYSGYLPTDFLRHESEMWSAVKAGNRDLFFRLLRERNVKLLKLNKNEFRESPIVEKWLLEFPGKQILWHDDSFLVIRFQ